MYSNVVTGIRRAFTVVTGREPGSRRTSLRIVLGALAVPLVALLTTGALSVPAASAADSTVWNVYVPVGSLYTGDLTQAFADVDDEIVDVYHLDDDQLPTGLVFDAGSLFWESGAGEAGIYPLDLEAMTANDSTYPRAVQLVVLPPLNPTLVDASGDAVDSARLPAGDSLRVTGALGLDLADAAAVEVEVRWNGEPLASGSPSAVGAFDVPFTVPGVAPSGGAMEVVFRFPDGAVYSVPREVALLPEPPIRERSISGPAVVDVAPGSVATVQYSTPDHPGSTLTLASGAPNWIRMSNGRVLAVPSLSAAGQRVSVRVLASWQSDGATAALDVVLNVAPSVTDSGAVSGPDGADIVETFLPPPPARGTLPDLLLEQLRMHRSGPVAVGSTVIGGGLVMGEGWVPPNWVTGGHASGALLARGQAVTDSMSAAVLTALEREQLDAARVALQGRLEGTSREAGDRMLELEQLLARQQRDRQAEQLQQLRGQAEAARADVEARRQRAEDEARRRMEEARQVHNEHVERFDRLQEEIRDRSDQLGENVNELTRSQLRAQQQLAEEAARGGSLPPGTQVTATMYSEPKVLGSTTVNAFGGWAIYAAVPHVPVGAHTVELVFTLPDGGQLTSSYPMTVGAQPALYDPLVANPPLVFEPITVPANLAARSQLPERALAGTGAVVNAPGSLGLAVGMLVAGIVALVGRRLGSRSYRIRSSGGRSSG